MVPVCVMMGGVMIFVTALTVISNYIVRLLPIITANYIIRLLIIIRLLDIFQSSMYP